MMPLGILGLQGVVLEEMWGWPKGPQPPQPFRQQMETSMWGSHYARYNSFMERPRAHGLQCPKGWWQYSLATYSLICMHERGL